MDTFALKGNRMLASDQKLTKSGLSPTAQSVLAMRGGVLAEWEDDMRRMSPAPLG